ncbi:MAG: tRNA (adenosine(37)-N6)-threonylcarbamoyltransferase complex transferase subunit TsaD [bacterium]
MKRILAIESSCDDTAVAVVASSPAGKGHRVLVSLVASQEKLHAQFGGVVPEMASRQHLRAIYPLIDLALKRAKLTPAKVDAIAVTTHPGLLGSLLVGVNAAKTLGYLWSKPVIGVNHLLGHIYAGWIGNARIVYPLISLVTSGGHSEIVLTRQPGEYKCIGGTRDDAAGEAFDKAARLLKLGYPGGPAIALKAVAGRPGKVSLPRPMLDEDNFDFSFSGLKTAVVRVKGKPGDIAYEFQEAVVETLAKKLFATVERYKAKTVLIGGGVAANPRLREEVKKRAKAVGVPVVIPDFKYCTDNAAMIGMAAFYIQNPKQDRWYNANVITD